MQCGEEHRDAHDNVSMMNRWMNNFNYIFRLLSYFFPQIIVKLFVCVQKIGVGALAIVWKSTAQCSRFAKWSRNEQSYKHATSSRENLRPALWQ